MMPSNKSTMRVVIPARYGSSRLPGKPLVMLAGKPLVVRVYGAVREALADVDIVVAVDDARIIATLDQYHIPAVLTSANHESGTDRVAEVARLMGWADSDVVINVQGDEPLIPADMLNAFAAFCSSHPSFSMGTLAAPLDAHNQIHDPNVVKLTMDCSSRALIFSRAPLPFVRDLPLAEWPLELYWRHVGIYAYRNDVLQRLTTAEPCILEQVEKLEQLRALWLGIPIDVMQWHLAPPLGVDTPEDARRVANIFEGATL